MFSNRLPDDTHVNALTLRLEALRADGVGIVDLTESNPTCVGIAYPPDLLATLADTRGLRYEPQPFGLDSARRAVADECNRRGARIDPAHLVLTASTSEAYSWLFKLLCSPGECVLVPRPSYPLFDHLTRLEGVTAHPYRLEYHQRWEIDFDSINSAPGNTTAVLVVSPNNPTGSYVSPAELERLSATCLQRGWAMVVDEVFADYPLDEPRPITDIATRTEGLSFTLGGLSKSLGLPQLKLGWMLVGGAAPRRAAALNALELIADTFLSVNTPVQLALPTLIDRAREVRTAIQGRIRANLAASRDAARSFPACEILRAEGGWSVVVRVPATRSEDDLVMTLLETERVLVHPGFFFDFQSEAYLVGSLLPDPMVFRDAMTRVLRFADC